MMWRLNQRARVFLALGHTDMRKSISGLSAIVTEELEGRLFSGDLFVFSNRRRNLIKIVYYDRNGFCLWMKRLARHQFIWPQNEGDVREIRRQELAWLLDGLDIGQAHEKLNYTAVI
jgi:transposase